jgi:putative ABC transport system permease protein
MERKGGSGFGNQDDQAFVPLTTMQSRLFGQRTARGLRNVSVINVQAVDEGQMKAAVEQIGQVLRERHRVNQDDFVVQSQEDFLQVAGQITGVMTALLGSIAGISLVVGGIGIMNIMLVSVTERTREIGIRKAVGARRRDILAQFLTEAVVVSLVGGGIGVALGVLLSTAIAQIDLGGQRLETLVAPDAVLLAFGVSAAIGLFFGIYPAARAARLNPIEALRYE